MAKCAGAAILCRACSDTSLDKSHLCAGSPKGRDHGCRCTRIVLLFIVGFITGYYYNHYRNNTPSLPTPCHKDRSATQPEQLHLSLGANDSEYYVTWSTMMPTETYLVWREKFCQDCQFQSIKAERTHGIFDSSEIAGQKYHKYSYRAKMMVVPDTEYIYMACGGHELTKQDFSAMECSYEYSFKTRAFNDPEKTLKAIFYGDLGLKNAQSVPRLTKEIEQSDLIIHNGDFAYDLNTENGNYGDKFFRLIEPIAACIPYQTSVGNHEIAGNFSEYNHRFTMINRGAINHGALNNFFYSFNAGPVHFVAFSTEFYYFLDKVGLVSLVNQYNWLLEDLKFASSLAERAKRPWIVVFGHRPMYCSSRDHDDCSKDSNLLRRGLPFTGAFALEKIFYDYGVDVELYSHEHQYERFLPIYRGAVLNGTDKPEEPYHNPLAPVHIISGSAGCQEKLDPFKGTPATGSVKQISDYGYTRLVATRDSLLFEQVSDDQNGTIVDRFIITKDKQNFPAVQVSII